MPRLALAFLAGSIAHFVFWLAVVNLDSTPMDFMCGEISCWVLFFGELPFSLFYISGSAREVTLGSLFFGSLWWGVIAVAALYFVKGFQKATSSDRLILLGVVILIGGVFGYLGLFPFAGSPDSKLRVALHEFGSYQDHLERVCRSGPLRPGALTFEQTGIPKTVALHKRLSRVHVQVSMLVPEENSLLLTVQLPELGADGIHSLWGSNVIPAGATLRSRGRCERGTLYWSRLESTLPEERLRLVHGP
jgi:hypothetical protein